MADYAIISNGVVVNVVVADPASVAEQFPGAIDLDSVTPRPGIGWTYNGSSWTAPVAPTPTNPVFAKVDFMDLFTNTELVNCFAYQSSTTLTDTQKAQMAVFFEYFQNTDTVDLTLAPTISGVEMLESFGLIATGRSAQILASRH